jgi:nicotinamidase-related amidase
VIARKAPLAAAVLAIVLMGPSAPVLELNARSRVESPGSSRFEAVSRVVKLDPRATAVIICDMWDRHWCPSATARVKELAPAINEFVTAARDQGMLIVHAPSDTMLHYWDRPGRRLARDAPRAPDLPPGMKHGPAWLDERERAAGLPIDDSDGGCDVPAHQYRAWSREIETIAIREGDVISDSGRELWNLFAARGIKNVLLVGVHANMCVVGRPFGLRNWVKYGKNALLVRDLTDSMYNPAMPPRVDHFTGTDLMIAHIETYICPTILSPAITGRPAFRFSADTRTRPDR